MKETVAGNKNVQEKRLQAFKNSQKTSLSVIFSSIKDYQLIRHCNKQKRCTIYIKDSLAEWSKHQTKYLLFSRDVGSNPTPDIYFFFHFSPY